MSEIKLPSGLSFDAALELVLIALVLLGPLPAFIVAVVPIVLGGLLRGETIIRQGNLANVAAYGWEALAGAAVLSLAGVSAASLGVEALPWLLLCGMVMSVVQVSIGPALYVPCIWVTRGPRSRACWPTRCPPPWSWSRSRR